MAVDLLILGAGWMSTFLIPLCEERGVSLAATSRTGRSGTIEFTFDPESDDLRPFEALPDARTILITFPIQVSGAPRKLVVNYKATRKKQIQDLAFIQLGSTGIWDKNSNSWQDRHTPIMRTPRALAEEELLSLFPQCSTTVLNLAGLWGGSRSPRNWVQKVAPTKEALQLKGSLHLIHGLDVARAVLAVHGDFSRANGKRWILTDGRVYDWWDLASAWGRANLDLASTNDAAEVKRDMCRPHAKWVQELMRECDIRALPRKPESLGHRLDSRDFWETFGICPSKARLDE